MYNSQISCLFLLLLAAYSFPLHSMETSSLQENAADIFSVDQYKKDPLSSAFAQHLLDIAPEDTKRLVNRLSRGGDRMKHCLLNGPSGTGKSTLARAIAKQAGRTCFFLRLPSIGSEYKNSEITVLRSFFEHVLQTDGHALIVLDEINHLVEQSKQQDMSIGEKGMACLWTYADQVKEKSNIALIATTNNQEKLPDQIRSRFRTMHIGVPNQEKRQAVLTYLLHDAALEIDNTVVAWAAKKTSGLTCRDLEDIVMQLAHLQYNDDASSIEDCFVQVVNGNAISIWSYFNPYAYNDEQWSKIEKNVKRGLILVSGAAGLYLGYRQYQLQQAGYILQKKAHKFAKKQAKQQMELGEKQIEIGERQIGNGFWSTLGSIGVGIASILVQIAFRGPGGEAQAPAPSSN